jgi:glycosyltransferase involved in cell wall biosynthesis
LRPLLGSAQPLTARATRRSRVLFISGPALVPAKIGPARRNHHILQQLCRFYDVSVVTCGEPEHADAIHASCDGRIAKLIIVPTSRGARERFALKLWRTATGRCDYLPALQSELHAVCAEIAQPGSFDAIVLSSLFLGGLPLPSDTPVVIDNHNVEFDIHRRTAAVKGPISRRLYAACQYWPTRREETRHGLRADLLLATSVRDRDLFKQKIRLERVAVVPNGIDLVEFRPHAPARSPVILFSGLMSYYPNQQGVRWFLDAVLPRVRREVPNARVVIAGASPPKWLIARREIGVDVTGAVVDMRPQFAAASVVIVPLKIGGGTRVKILEAQAMERPVVSTAVGAEGLAQRHDETILLGDDEESFAAHVIRLLKDRSTAARIARGGRRHVVQHFDWDRIGNELNRLLTARVGLSGYETMSPNLRWRANDRTH